MAAMTMMFSLFFCQRIERSITHAIDRLVDRELLKRFEFKDPEHHAVPRGGPVGQRRGAGGDQFNLIAADRSLGCRVGLCFSAI